MLVSEIFSFIDETAPFSSAMDFDNSGLLVGDPQAEVQKVLVALDCTNSCIEKAHKIGAQLIVSHHPVIFNGIKEVPAQSPVYLLARYEIAAICAHTNLDIADGGVNDCLADKLGLSRVRGLSRIICRDKNGGEIIRYLGRLGLLPEAMPPVEFARFVKERLNTAVRFCSGNRDIKRVAVCGGAGADCLGDAISCGADALVTSEVKHHIFLQAHSSGITLVDAGHLPTEDVVVEPLCRMLQNRFPDLSVEAYHLDEIMSL